MKLENKVAIVTGSSRGIGRAAAILFAQEGARVVVNYKDDVDAAQEVVDSIGHENALLVQADVSQEDDVKRLVSTTLERFGRIDILVNNAGILIPKPFDEITRDIWDRTLNSNALGAYHCIRAVSGEMKKQKYGKIVNVTSIASIVGSLTSAAYAVSKAGVDALTKTLASELGKYTITINSVAPGPVHTDLLHEIYSKELIDKLEKETPMGRIASPEDIARVLLFFASDDSRFVNGQTLIVDGGRIIR